MILLQILTVFFAIACAWLNKWPVVTFRYHGLSKDGEKDFHAANGFVKVLWAFVIEVLLTGPYWHKVQFFFLLLLIQWLVFDIALNLFTGKSWHYLGQTAWLDKLVKNGKVKAAVVLALIIALNFLL